MKAVSYMITYEEEGAAQIHVPHAIPIRLGQIEHRLGLDDAGVVHQDVDAVELRGHVVHIPLHRGHVGDVNAMGQSAAARDLDLQDWDCFVRLPPSSQ
jgi:hypothetical protein